MAKRTVRVRAIKRGLSTSDSTRWTVLAHDSQVGRLSLELGESEVGSEEDYTLRPIRPVARLHASSRLHATRFVPATAEEQRRLEELAAALRLRRDGIADDNLRHADRAREVRRAAGLPPLPGDEHRDGSTVTRATPHFEQTVEVPGGRLELRWFPRNPEPAAAAVAAARAHVEQTTAAALANDPAAVRFANACERCKSLITEHAQAVADLGAARLVPDAQLRDKQAFSTSFAEVVRLERLVPLLACELERARAEVGASRDAALDALRAAALAALPEPDAGDRAAFDAVVAAVQAPAAKLPAVPRPVAQTIDVGKVAEAVVAAQMPPPAPAADVEPARAPVEIPEPVEGAGPQGGLRGVVDTTTRHGRRPGPAATTGPADPDYRALAPDTPGGPRPTFVGPWGNTGR
jgi:hypothetical protein